MNARINIKTPAGKSLEGFPQTHKIPLHSKSFDGAIAYVYENMLSDTTSLPSPDLHKGDIITIEILA